MLNLARVRRQPRPGRIVDRLRVTGVRAIRCNIILDVSAVIEEKVQFLVPGIRAGRSDFSGVSPQSRPGGISNRLWVTGVLLLFCRVIPDIGSIAQKNCALSLLHLTANVISTFSALVVTAKVPKINIASTLSRNRIVEKHDRASSCSHAPSRVSFQIFLSANTVAIRDTEQVLFAAIREPTVTRSFESLE